MDTPSQWHPQDMVVKTMEDMASRPKLPLTQASGGVEERKSRTQKEEALNCPRCNSTNTKFCYYNNYSLSQPRYFCKTCRRYWTHGGSLRSIPVGGGSRKNKRPSSSSTSSSRNIKLPDLQALPPYHHHHHHQNPKNQDLDLGFTIHHSNYDDFKSITEMIQAPDFSLDSGTRPEIRLLQNPNSATGYAYVPPLMTAATGAEISTSLAFSNLPEFKLSNSLNISLDQGLGSNYEGLQASESKVLFPFEELKQDDESSKGNKNIDNNDSEEGGDDQEHGDANGGYWNGVLGGGSW